MTTEELRETIEAYLAEHHAMTLATCSGDVPWATSVFYAHAGFVLYFVSSSTSRHARNIAKNPLVAAAINQDYDDWRVIRGVQLEGTAERVGPMKFPSVFALYCQKFPSVRGMLTEGGMFRIAGKLVSAQFYQVTPTRVHYLDNRVAFGRRRELIL